MVKRKPSGAGKRNSSRGRAAPRRDGEPFVATWLQIEDGHITRVRVTVDRGKPLQAGYDPRRGSAHHRPAL